MQIYHPATLFSSIQFCTAQFFFNSN
jgi:hypothetical protein